MNIINFSASLMTFLSATGSDYAYTYSVPDYNTKLLFDPHIETSFNHCFPPSVQMSTHWIQNIYYSTR